MAPSVSDIIRFLPETTKLKTKMLNFESRTPVSMLGNEEVITVSVRTIHSAHSYALYIVLPLSLSVFCTTVA